jgi:transposase-like protein
VASQVGDVPLEVPRDRDRTFIPRLVPKGSRRLGGLDEMVVRLYAGGMTIRDIQHHLASTIGTELSAETISKITGEVLDEVAAWQHRPLESLYPVVYLDALVVKVRDGAHVRNKTAHIAIGGAPRRAGERSPGAEWPRSGLLGPVGLKRPGHGVYTEIRSASCSGRPGEK